MTLLRRTWLSAVLAVCFAVFCASSLPAETIANPADPGWRYSSSSDLPSGLSGWFYNSTGPLFPAQTDLSQPWTSAANIALMNSWLNLVNQAAGDPDALARLIGLGQYESPSTGSSQMLLSSSQELPASAPEPTMLWLMAVGLAVLSLYAAFRSLPAA